MNRDHWFRHCRPCGSTDIEERIVLLEERKLLFEQLIDEIGMPAIHKPRPDRRVSAVLLRASLP
jgi:hypothetical protein